MSISLTKTIAGTQLPITYGGGISASAAISGYSPNISIDRTALALNEDAANLKQTLSAYQALLIEAWELNELSGPRSGTRAGLSLIDNNTVSYSGSITSNSRRTITNQYFTTPSSSHYDLAGASFTVMSWFFKEAATGTGTLIARRVANATDYEYVLYAHNSAVMQFLVTDGTTATISSGTTTVLAKTWTCGFGIYDATAHTITCAVNGEAANGSASTSGKDPTVQTAKVAFGAVKNAAGETYTNFFGGRLGAQAGFVGALSLSERQELYNNGIQPTYSQLSAALQAKVKWWVPMNQTSGGETETVFSDTVSAVNSPDYRCGNYTTAQDSASARFVLANSEYLSRTGGTVTGLDSYSGNFSVELAVRPESFGIATQQTYVGKGATSNGSKGFWINKNGSSRPQITLGDGTTRVTVNPSNVFSAGVLYHIVCTINRSGNMSMYINGALGTGSPTASISAIPGDLGTVDLTIGGLSSSTFNEGEIGFVRIYNKELSSGDVTYLYNSGALRSYANL